MDLVVILSFIVGSVIGFFTGRITSSTTATNSGKDPVSKRRESNNTNIK